MLPIDEHAKSGALVLVETDEPNLNKYQLARWVGADFETCIGWYDLKRVRGYIPISWVENAGAMRVELVLWNEEVGGSEETQRLVLMTEWPKKGDVRHEQSKRKNHGRAR